MSKIECDVLESVDSSNISLVGYNRDLRVMGIEFHNGAVVGYRDVSEPVFEALVSAASVGSYYNTYIRGIYRGLPASNYELVVKVTKEEPVDITPSRVFTIAYVFEGTVDIEADSMDAALAKFNASASGGVVKVKSVTVNFED